MVRAGFPDHATYAADITCVTRDPLAAQPKSPAMKKYLPSLDELVSGVVIIVVGLVVWNFVSPVINELTMKLKPKASA